MAEEIHHPHDLMVRAVLSDLTEAVSFLQAHLPDEVSQGLNWSTLRLVEGSFVDEGLRSSEADLLYEVEQVSSPDAVWLSPFNMCMAVPAPRLYAVATKNSLHVSEAKMRVICCRAGSSSSNSDVERAARMRRQPTGVESRGCPTVQS